MASNNTHKWMQLYGIGNLLLVRTLPITVGANLNPFPNKPWFLHVCSTSLENTVGKEKIAHSKQFLFPPPLPPPLFSTRLDNFLLLSSNFICHLQTLSVWKTLKFVVWERLKVFAPSGGLYSSLAHNKSLRSQDFLFCLSVCPVIWHVITFFILRTYFINAYVIGYKRI